MPEFLTSQAGLAGVKEAYPNEIESLHDRSDKGISVGNLNVGGSVRVSIWLSHDEYAVYNGRKEDGLPEIGHGGWLADPDEVDVWYLEVKPDALTAEKRLEFDDFMDLFGYIVNEGL